ncbi:MAG: hydrogenase nickel incorporation protein HypB [Rhodospirillales bacterium]
MAFDRAAQPSDHVDRHDHGHDHHHGDDHSHAHGHAHEHSPAGRTSSGAARRLVRVEQDILTENDRLAAGNRAFFADRRILAINLMSGPGAGKTTLLARTIADLCGGVPIAVIEGDQETSFDAERIRATGAPAIQINTGKGCHLDARMVSAALPILEPERGSVVFIENVGNLVCPAAFDLGEAARVVLLSVTEGDDKPLKYANMFAAADLMLITKIDLLPFVPFDLQHCAALARRINAEIEILEVSATNGAGLGSWYDWIARRRAARRVPMAIGTDAG